MTTSTSSAAAVADAPAKETAPLFNPSLRTVKRDLTFDEALRQIADPSFKSLPAAQHRPKVISAAQLAANKANAQLSCGPKSEATRAISAQNRTTHGLARHNGAFRLLPSEDANGFEALKASLAEEHKPQTTTECILVNTMAESHWLANRAQNLQATVCDPDTGQITDAKLASLYLRYYTTHQRAFNKALADLLKLRKEKRIAQNGFEAQKRRDSRADLRATEERLQKEDEECQLFLSNPEFRRDSLEVGRAYNKSPEEKARIHAKFDAKWGAELKRIGNFGA